MKVNFTISNFADRTNNKNHSGFNAAFTQRLENFDPEADPYTEMMAQNLMKVCNAGIPIVVGTDAGNPGTLHGISIFDEMEAMQQAGIDPADLIVMAIQNGAKTMRRFEDFGSIEAGKFANFVVLNEDHQKTYQV